MTILTVYEDQAPTNPILYTGIVGNTILDCHEREEVEAEVRKAVAHLGINTDIEEVMYGLLGYRDYGVGFHWVDEHYCFALSNVVQI